MSPEGDAPAGAATEVVGGRPMSVPIPEAAPDLANEALQARQSVGQAVEQRAARRRPAPPPDTAPPGPDATEDQLRAYYMSGAQDDGPELLERTRLNAQNSRYRGTAFGAMRLASLADLYKTPDGPNDSPEVKAAKQQARDEYVEAVADLTAYDAMPDWSGWKQFGAAVVGTVGGSLTSPEAAIGWGAQGTSWALRSFKAGLQQAGVQGATDPVVQGLNILAGVQDEYHPEQTIESMLFGFGLGAGGHQLTEAGPALSRAFRESYANLAAAIGQDGPMELRRTLYDLGKLDPAFLAPDHAAWALDPNSGIGRMQPGELNPDEWAIPTTPAAETPPVADLPSWREAVEAERETLYDENKRWRRGSAGTRTIKGGTEYAKPKNRLVSARASMVDQTAAYNAMVKEAEGPIKAMGDLEPADIAGISRFNERKEGETPKEAFDRAYDRYYDDAERKAIQEFGLEDDVQTYVDPEFPPIKTDEEIPFGDESPPARPGEGGREPAAREGQVAAGEGGTDGGRGGVPGEAGGGARTQGSEGPRGERVEGPKTELTDQGEQPVLMDVGRATPEEMTARERAAQKEEAEARMRGRKQAGVGQESAEDTPLFGGERQGGLLDAKPATAAAGFPPEIKAEDVQAIIDQGRNFGVEATPADLARLYEAKEGEAAIVSLRKAFNRFIQEQRGDQALVRTPGEPLRGEREPTPRNEPLSAEQEAAVVSLQQQSIRLAQALDIPLREGRVTIPRAAGMFKGVSGTARVRSLPYFQVVVHEMVHGLEKKVPGLSQMAETFEMILAPLDYDLERQDWKEGLAEWIRMRVTNPEYARNAAPSFATAFDAFMERTDPEIMKILNDAAEAYEAYRGASPADRIRAVRVVRKTDGTFTAAINEAQRKGLPPVIKAVMQSAYDKMIDVRAPMERAVRALGAMVQAVEGGAVALKAAENPYVLLRLSGRAQQAAVLDLIDGPRGYHAVDEMGPRAPGLSDALAKATGESQWGRWNNARMEDFSDYLIARRASYLWDRRDQGLMLADPAPFNKETADEFIAEMEAANPTFREASDMVHLYSRQMLKKAFDGGLVDPDVYAKSLEHEFYVPFYRDLTDKPGTSEGVRATSESTVVRGIRGSQRDILDPVQSLMKQAYFINQALQHNDIIRSLVNLGERAGPGSGKYVEQIPAQEAKRYTANLEDMIRQRARERGLEAAEVDDIMQALGDPEGESSMDMAFFRMEKAAANGEPIVFYREGGQLKAARVMSSKEGMDLYGLLTQAPKPVADIFTQMVGTAASVKRAGIITSPVFILTNYIRDQMAASILRNDYLPFVHGTQGIKDEFMRGNSAVLYSYMGGVAGGHTVGPVEHAFEVNRDALAKKGYAVTRFGSTKEVMEALATGRLGDARSTAPEAIKDLLEVASLTEAGTRNSIFKTVYDQKIAQGLNSYEAAVEAAFQAQDMLDFSRHGSYTQITRNLLPFFNAHIQGVDKAYRTMIEPIIRRKMGGEVFASDSAEYRNAVQAWVKAGAVGAGLGAVWAAVMSGKEGYKDASPYFKGTHLVIPYGANNILVVPKPFELGMGFTFGEYAYHMMAEKDPRAAAQFVDAAWQALKPPMPWEDLPGITTAFEMQTGKSLFTGRDIVPERYQRLPPEMQFNDRTSELAKWLGKQTGMSPMKIEYAIGSEFGTWGRDIMSLSQGISEDTPAASLDNQFLLRRFIKDPTRSGVTTGKFWDYMSQKTGHYNQDVALYRDLVRDAVVRGQDATQAREFLNKLTSPERVFVTMKEGARPDGKPAFTADERKLHPLQHAYDAVTALNTISAELASNKLVPYGQKERMPLSPEQRRDLLQNVRVLAMTEMRNAFVTVGEPGYEGRPFIDPNETMALIRQVSPNVAAEIATRYATGKIYNSEAINRAWPRLRDEVARAGSEARLGSFLSEVRLAGPEFQGSKVKKPPPLRQPIGPSP